MAEHELQHEAAEAASAEAVVIASSLTPVATLSQAASTTTVAGPNWAALPASVWYHILKPSSAVSKDARRTCKDFCAAYSTNVAGLSKWRPLPAAVAAEPRLEQRFPCLAALHLDRQAARDAGWIPCLESTLLGLPHLQVLSLQGFPASHQDLVGACSALMAATGLLALHTLDLRNAMAGGQPSMDALAGLLRAGTHLSTLEHLELSGNGIRAPPFVALCAALAAATHLTRLRSLNLSSNPCPDGSMERFTDAVLSAGHLGGLQRLEFHKCQLKLESDMQQLGRLLKLATHVRGLRQLHLGQSGITADGATVLAAALAYPYATHLASLRELGIGGNWAMGSEGVGMLVRALASAPHLAHLEVLDLGATNLGDKGAAELAHAICEPPGHLASLRELYLHHNNIGDDGAVALSRALRAAPVPLCLTVLALGRNHIRFRGVDSLASVLRLPALRSLEMLDFGVMNHSGRGWDSVGKKGNEFGVRAVRVLATALAAATHMTSLRTLSLGGNSIRDAGLRCIVSALAGAPHLARLRTLEVPHCEVEKHCVAEVEAMVRAVPHLQQLRIVH